MCHYAWLLLVTCCVCVCVCVCVCENTYNITFTILLLLFYVCDVWVGTSLPWCDHGLGVGLGKRITIGS